MPVERPEQCAYCGRPLHVVAGFCAGCHAPISVAQRSRLVAIQRQQRHVTVPVTLPPTLPLPPATRPMSAFTRMVTGMSVLSLALVVIFIGVRLRANPLPALFPPPPGTLSISLAPQGDAVSSIQAGQTVYLRYSVDVTANTAEVSLTIAPAHLPARTLLERWPQGQLTRTQALVATAPDTWNVTLRNNGVVVQTLTLRILP